MSRSYLLDKLERLFQKAQLTAQAKQAETLAADREMKPWRDWLGTPEGQERTDAFFEAVGDTPASVGEPPDTYRPEFSPEWRAILWYGDATPRAKAALQDLLRPLLRNRHKALR